MNRARVVGQKYPAPAASIVVHGIQYPAAVCRICAGRIYPPEGLELHEKQHSPDAKRWIKDGYGNYREVRKWEMV
jgi:hypothetical protein